MDAGRLQRAEVQLHVQFVGPDEVGGGAAGLDGAERTAARHTAGQVEQFAGRGAHRHAVHAGALDVPGDREELQPGVLVAVLARPPLRLPPGGAAQRDDRDVRERLDRVHQRRLAVQAVGAGERRLVPRLAAVPFHALDERRLLAEDVAARRGKHLDVQPPAGSACVRADQAGVAQVLDLAADDLLLRAVLVPDEHPAFFGADREHAEQHALEHQVRLGGEDVPVLERAWLGLIGVADDVRGRCLLSRHQVPLAAGREPGAAHAAQPAVLQRGDDLAAVQLVGQHRLDDAVAVLGRGVRIVGPSGGGRVRGGRGVVAVRVRPVRRRRFLRRRHRGVRLGFAQNRCNDRRRTVIAVFPHRPGVQCRQIERPVQLAVPPMLDRLGLRCRFRMASCRDRLSRRSPSATRGNVQDPSVTPSRRATPVLVVPRDTSVLIVTRASRSSRVIRLSAPFRTEKQPTQPRQS